MPPGSVRTGRFSPHPDGTRIYSNEGFNVLAAALEAKADMPFREYLREAVLGPLALSAELRGDAGSGLVGTLADLLEFGRELLAPTLVARETLTEATQVRFPGLRGVLPGYGRQDPNDWGLGFESKDAKSPHWTGSRTLPAHSATSARSRAARPFSGSTPRWASRAPLFPTPISARGRSTPGRASATP